ncbi:MAG: hypothetical protein NC485_10185 [Ruminococcus flavefaciens]|nr:hypothetical protein [Ruminococcus flavefaciens]MCM1059265.1 hypothetical protein [Eubacterium sp.]
MKKRIAKKQLKRSLNIPVLAFRTGGLPNSYTCPRCGNRNIQEPCCFKCGQRIYFEERV